MDEKKCGKTTEKIYETDGHARSFEARVISCEPSGDGWAIELDRTAFFPEGGGQLCDTGTLGGAKVSNVQIQSGRLLHYTDSPLDAGMTVQGEIDWEQRFRRIQNHSGEHIVSGHIHNLFGYDNVGFHMGSEDITLDTSGPLSGEQIDIIERLANETVAANVPITVSFPTAEELASLEYRSKLDLTEDVRVVTVEGVDRCACCAPHVSRTGEIGIIKILDRMSYKGGMRLHLQCGFDALDDYNRRFAQIRGISELLSAKQSEILSAVERLNSEASAQRRMANELRQRIAGMRADAVAPTDGDILIFEPELSMDELRRMVGRAAEKCGRLCAGFSGDDENGYQYSIICKGNWLRIFTKQMNTALSGRGGGSDRMTQGSVKALKSEIESFFSGWKEP